VRRYQKACVIRRGGVASIRLKCPKRIINLLGNPEKGNTDTVSYNVTGSSMRVNLGAAFAYLFQRENKITVTIKASKDGIVEHGLFLLLSW
jgi:Lhr-like helicase